ncbi:LysM peptidoglycan-binding domain-containing protein [Tepidanaerobacter sp. EBM-38]|uniref:LysM peptidoglycan-binding domain-containing protein n=1 Tax=Tepidanaerobacter sp. EBM-38 TaxID=1918496 RepID=UPI000AF63175|nr:LysM peptidoglycan-binding domain-containing protein [Tepidanaerobacter sp. EBM-38]
MKKRIVSLFVVFVILLSMFNGIVFAQESNQIMTIHENLLHPRRGHSNTVIGDVMWITGGRAYYSHFLGWGQDGIKEFQDFPNIEWINLKTGEKGYTNVSTGKDYYKSTAFTTSDDSPYIYIAAKNRMLKFNTETLEIIPMEDIGVLGNWNTGSWGRMVINGKEYTVILGEDGLVSIFDPNVEKFIRLDSIDYEVPAAALVDYGYSGVVIDNKFYIFGGGPSIADKIDEDEEGAASTMAWVFDPNAPKDSQWKRIGDLPAPTDSPWVATVRGKAYIIGGRNMGEFLPTVYEYTPETNTYIRKSDLPFGTQKHAVASYGDSIWITYGYTWGTEEENKFGFRMHHPYVVEYKPLLDDVIMQPGQMKSIKGDKMNINLTWPDPDKVTGKNQTISVNWLANTSSTEGTVYLREKDKGDFKQISEKPVYFSMGTLEAHAYNVVLENLKPDTWYEYYIESKGPNPIKSETYTIKTNPEHHNEFTFFVYGDSKAQYDVFNDLNADILKTLDKNAKEGAPGFAAFTGDYGGNGAFIEYDAWFNYGVDGKSNSKELLAQYPMIHVHGNHERLAPTWWNMFNFPVKAIEDWPDLNNKGYEEYWFSYNYGNVHIIALMTGFPNQEFHYKQLEWLRNDLERAKTAKKSGEIDWVVVLLHHSIYTTSTGHMHDVLEGAGLMREGDVVDTIDNSRVVDVVFTAHDHNYERTKNIRGYRSKIVGDLQEAKYYKLDNAYAEESSGRFGEATAGNGTIFITSAGAGAQNRDLYPISEVGDSSWLAFRKNDPDRGESASTHPVHHYMKIDVTPDCLHIQAIEKDSGHLAGWEGADDGFSGLLDSVIIKKPSSEKTSAISEAGIKPDITYKNVPKTTEYIVQTGDVLWKIAEKFGTTWQKLQELNKLANPHLIYPGQKLLVPKN